ncbi:hypothetical protein B0H19DRAFT_1067975 [Mycena capillaripes]|nr:hypothetical protein B0H19DRAFT_1067975 [Mycena capillaripes]
MARKCTSVGAVGGYRGFLADTGGLQNFLVVIVGHTLARSHQLLGSAEISRSKIITSSRDKTKLNLELRKVHDDGPSLTLRPSFSFCQSSMEPFSFDGIYVPEDRIFSFDLETITHELEKMLDSIQDEPQVTSLDVWLMHQRILLLFGQGTIRAALLSFLGGTSSKLYNRTNLMDDLNQTISAYDDATRDNPTDNVSHRWLGLALRRRFERLSNAEDIHRSVLALDVAVALTADGHSDKSIELDQLGSALLYRFSALGDIDDIQRAVVALEHAVQFAPDDDPGKPEFERLGDIGDLNKSILLFEEAVKLTPTGYPDRASIIHDFGTWLLARFELLGDLSDISQSILLCEEAVGLVPEDHPNKPLMVASVGISLLGRFKRFTGIGDLKRAISTFEDALRLTPENHPERPSRLHNFTTSLHQHFERLGDLANINKAILTWEETVRLTPEDHPDKGVWLNHLGQALNHRFVRSGNLHARSTYSKGPYGQSSDATELRPLTVSADDFEEMIVQYASAARLSIGPASDRFRAAVVWSLKALAKGDPSVLQAYDVVVSLLPEVAWLGLSLSDRYHKISKAGQIVRLGVGVAIANHQFRKAIEWSEQGRSIIWSQMLNLRSPVDLLRASHPRLGDELIRLSSYLDSAGTRENFRRSSNPGNQLLDSQVFGQRYHDHAHARNNLLKMIRSLSGFQTFLLPKTMSELYLAAREGPVVVLNTTEIREGEDVASEEEFAQILWNLWFRVTKPVLHALGLSGKEKQDLVVSDRSLSISSYSHRGSLWTKLAQASAPGQNYIPGTREEIRRTDLHAKGKHHILPLEQEMATVASVEKGMRDSSWAHFACHESVHLAAGMLLAGYRGVIATMWSIMDNAPQVAGDVYEHLFKTSPPDHTQAAEALHMAVMRLQEQSDGKKSFFDWVPFIHVGA